MAVAERGRPIQDANRGSDRCGPQWLYRVDGGAMSLTRELKIKDSWVRQFLDERFGQLGNFVRRIGADVKSMPIEVAPQSNSGLRNATVGKALDYRLRLHHGWNPAESKELERGIHILARRSGPTAGERRKCRDRAQALLAVAMPRSEDAQARASVVLAWLDDLYRGNGWPEGLNPVVDRLRESDTGGWDACAAKVDRSLADEVGTLMAVAAQVFPEREAICGPGFAGSMSVGGADADLIVEGCLYEVKTTKAPRDRLVDSFRQLLGYVLLDWSDEYRLERAGFYFARQGKRMSWPLGELVSQTTGEAEAMLAGLRDDFRGLAESRRETGD